MPNPWAAPQTGRDAARTDPRFDTRFAPNRYDPAEAVFSPQHGGGYPYSVPRAGWRDPDSRWAPSDRTAQSGWQDSGSRWVPGDRTPQTVWWEADSYWVHGDRLPQTGGRESDSRRVPSDRIPHTTGGWEPGSRWLPDDRTPQPGWREPDLRWAANDRVSESGRPLARDVVGNLYPPISWPPIDLHRRDLGSSDLRGGEVPRLHRDDRRRHSEAFGIADADPQSFAPGGWLWPWGTSAWGTLEGSLAFPGLSPYLLYPGTGMLYPSADEPTLDWTLPWLGLYPFWFAYPSALP